MRRSLIAALLSLFLAPRAVGHPDPRAEYRAYVTEYPPVYSIAGFDFLSRLEVFRPFDGERKTFSFRRPDGTYSVTWNQHTATVILMRDGRTAIEIPLVPFLDQVESYLAAHPGAAARALPQEALTWERTNGQVKVKLFFDDISLRRERNGIELYHFKADLLVKSSETGRKR